jgi:hypothetical protein
MAVNPVTFLDDMKAFIADSFQWCKSESEQESTRILVALQNVMEDVKRRSKMSAAAEQSLIAAQGRLAVMVEQSSQVSLDDLLGELRSLKSDNAEVSRLVNPVIEALQFQDRLVQNMTSIQKVIAFWFDFERNHNVDAPSPELRQKLMNELLKRVVTVEERSIIREHLSDQPSPQEQRAAS